MGGGCSRDAGPSGQQPEHRPRKLFLDAGLDPDSSQLKHDKLKAGSKELVAKESHRRSLAKKRSAISVAERLMALHAGQNFYEAYERVSLVSYGASCKVMTAYSKSTKLKVACKTIPKSTRKQAVQRAAMLNEIGIMKEVEDHPNAVKLLEVYETHTNYYIVMDCCDGGELFEHITQSKEAFTERHAAQILRSLMLFLAHMHSKGMAHMDIKPENIMFDSDGSKGVLKVIDFGSSTYIQPDEKVRDAFGTVRYSSPEMAADMGIGQKTDVWSAGIVMYFMLCGSAPFLKKDEYDTLNYIKNKPKVKFTSPRWAHISQQAKDCISAMLEVEPEKRPSAQEVLQMAWLRTQGPDTSIQTDILQHLRTFANQSRMRRLLLGLMAAKLSGAEANRLLNQFYTMDSDFSGTIELQELARVTKQALPDLDPSEVEKLFYALDLNRTGTVDVKEFFASLLHTMAPENQLEVARKSFYTLERTKSGYVSKQSFISGMVAQAKLSGLAEEDVPMLQQELQQEFALLDTNGDGKLSFEEFKSVLGIDEGRTKRAQEAGGEAHDAPRMSPSPFALARAGNNSGRLLKLSVCAIESGPGGTATVAVATPAERADIVRLALAIQENQKKNLTEAASLGAPKALSGIPGDRDQVQLRGEPRAKSLPGFDGGSAGAGAGTRGGGAGAGESARQPSRLGVDDGVLQMASFDGEHSNAAALAATSRSASFATAAAAAAMAAAVAATAAASPPDPVAMSARSFDDDGSWPLDPAVKARRSYMGGLGGSGGGGTLPTVISPRASHVTTGARDSSNSQGAGWQRQPDEPRSPSLLAKVPPAIPGQV